MSAPVYYPVHELAGVQEDPMAEWILALLFTDRPVRSTVRPGGTRRHWQFWARTDRQNHGSKLWLDVGEPITDDTVALMKSRAENALAPLLDDRNVVSVTVSVHQVATDAVALDVLVQRKHGGDLTVGVALEQGGG